MQPLSGLLPLFTWILFIGIACIAVTIGVVLAYHWHRFSMSPTVPTIASTVYGIGTAALLMLLLAAAVAV